MARTTRSPEVVRQIVLAVVLEAIGKAGGPLRLEAQDILAETFFANCHTAYIAKSHGWPDEFGDTWQPLDKKTIEKKMFGFSPSVTGGTAFIPDATRRKEWFERRDLLLAQLIRGGMSAETARVKANDLAWGGNIAASGVPINIDTGLLANALSPGIGYKPGQVRQFWANVMVVGADVDYAVHVHRKRPIIPSVDKAVVWIRRGLAQVTDRVKEVVEERLR